MAEGIAPGGSASLPSPEAAFAIGLGRAASALTGEPRLDVAAQQLFDDPALQGRIVEALGGVTLPALTEEGLSLNDRVDHLKSVAESGTIPITELVVGERLLLEFVRNGHSSTLLVARDQRGNRGDHFSLTIMAQSGRLIKDGRDRLQAGQTTFLGYKKDVRALAQGLRQGAHPAWVRRVRYHQPPDGSKPFYDISRVRQDERYVLNQAYYTASNEPLFTPLPR